MKKQLITIVSILFLFCIGLSGCFEPSVTKEQLIGTWELEQNSKMHLALNADGTYGHNIPLFTGTSGTWDIRDGKLILEYSGAFSSDKQLSKYDVSLSDNILKLSPESGGLVRVFYRV
jgi:hypothetical protein